MVVRIVVESLHAAAAGEHDLGPRHDRPFAIEAILVVKHFGGVAAANADVRLEKQPRAKQIGADAVAALADEAVRIGHNGQRTIEQVIVRNLGHRPSFAEK